MFEIADALYTVGDEHFPVLLMIVYNTRVDDVAAAWLEYQNPLNILLQHRRYHFLVDQWRIGVSLMVFRDDCGLDN